VLPLSGLDKTRIKRGIRAADGAKSARASDHRISTTRESRHCWSFAGVPLTEVRDLPGYSTVMMTERYAHLAPENVLEAVRKLEGLSRSGHADDHAHVVKSVPGKIILPAFGTILSPYSHVHSAPKSRIEA
jgi:hypothetical protein